MADSLYESFLTWFSNDESVRETYDGDVQGFMVQQGHGNESALDIHNEMNRAINTMSNNQAGGNMVNMGPAGGGSVPPPPAPAPGPGGDMPSGSEYLGQVEQYVTQVSENNFTDNSTNIVEGDTITDASSTANVTAFGSNVDIDQSGDTNVASGDGAAATSGEGNQVQTGDGVQVGGDVGGEVVTGEGNATGDGSVVAGGDVTQVSAGEDAILGDGNVTGDGNTVGDGNISVGGDGTFGDGNIQVEGDGNVNVGGEQTTTGDITAGDDIAFGEGSQVGDNTSTQIDADSSNVQVAGEDASQAGTVDQSTDASINDSFNDQSTEVDTEIDDSFNDQSTEIDDSFNDQSTEVDTEIDDSFNTADSFNDQSVEQSVNDSFTDDDAIDIA